MIKTKTKKQLKRALSCVLAFVMTVSMSTVLPAAAEEVERYPYVILAADERAGVTVDADSFTLNGNAHSNGEFSVTSQYSNINGKITDIDEVEDKEETEEVFDVSSDMIFMHNKLTNKYFTENCLTFDESYTYSDNNVNINNPLYVTGELNLEGNINLNNAIGAVSDIELSEGSLNGNNTVIYSKFGDIDISGSQTSVNGLIYAPFGTVTIDSDNFNLNGIIIAQSVVISCEGNVNINYNYGVGEMIGTETEEVSWTFEEWEYLVDTDDDGIPDLVEKEIETDPYIPDTDGDKLTDGYEVLYLGTDPNVVDSDENGVSDADEDFDEDGLTNIQEYEKETDPYNEDTDGDEFKDGEEVNTYFTNPIVADTDADGLDDGDEIHFNTNPLNPDTDGDSIPDGNEKRFQTFIHEAENKDSAVTEVRVFMNATGNLEKTTTIESIMGKDILCSEVVGLIGEPFSIETTSQFDKATITYVIDKSKLGETEFDNLLFLWYDEENNEFVELDTILDEENSTVSVETTHFSCYMLVDQVEWFEAWKMASLYFEEHYEPLASVICYDCSGSMISNDPNFMHNVFDDAGRIVYSYPTCYRKLAIDNFIDSMKTTDLTALVSFETSATLVSGFSDDKNALKNLVKPYNKGLTNAQAAIDIALDELSTAKHWYSRHIILLSDGDVNVTDAQLLQAKKVEIKIHTIGLGAGANNKELQKYADETGGRFFVAATAEELEEIYQDLSIKNHFDLKGLPDEDEDGLPDEFEVSGMILPNGQIFYTDSEIKDCDGDNLADGEEIFIDYSETQFVIKKDKRGGNIEYSTVVFGYRSDPNQKYCKDNKNDSTVHTLSLTENGYYDCINCAYEVISPDCQDKEIMSEDDYLRVKCLRQEYINSLVKELDENSSLEEIENHYYKSPYIAEIELIRQSSKYVHQYDYKGSNGKYHSDFCEKTNIDKLIHKYDNKGKLRTTVKIQSWVETVDKSNIVNYRYIYEYVPVAYGIVGILLGNSEDVMIGNIGANTISLLPLSSVSVGDIAWTTFSGILSVLPISKRIKSVVKLIDVFNVVEGYITSNLTPKCGDKHVYVQYYSKCHCGYRTCKQPLWTETREYIFREGELIYVI